MKKTRTCPKCGGSEVVRADAENFIYLGFNRAGISCWVCCTCGFIEEWVQDAGRLEQIKNRYKK